MPSRKSVMAELTRLLETNQLRPVIGRVFPLGEARAAMQSLMRGDVLGKIVLVPNAS